MPSATQRCDCTWTRTHPRLWRFRTRQQGWEPLFSQARRTCCSRPTSCSRGAMQKRARDVRWRVTASIGVIVLLRGFAAVHAERLPLRTYTVLEGLPHDRVMKIVRDSEGFLWFCTQGGLGRFDGHGFRTFGVDDGLPSQSTNHFLQDRAGQLWVATNGGGIARFLKPSESDVDSASAANGGNSTRMATLFRLYPVGDEVKTGR